MRGTANRFLTAGGYSFVSLDIRETGLDAASLLIGVSDLVSVMLSVRLQRDPCGRATLDELASQPSCTGRLLVSQADDAVDPSIFELGVIADGCE